jgi:hypothetical protein
MCQYKKKCWSGTSPHTKHSIVKKKNSLSKSVYILSFGVIPYRTLPYGKTKVFNYTKGSKFQSAPFFLYGTNPDLSCRY